MSAPSGALSQKALSESVYTKRLPMWAAVVLAAPMVASAQTQPVPPVQEPAIQTAPAPQKQPPVADALNLPEAPAPQAVSQPVQAALAAAKPQDLGHGVTTPVSTGQPLALSLDDAVRIALEHNLTISVDLQNQRQISGLQKTAFSALIPTMTAVGKTNTQEVNLAAMGFKPSSVAALLPPGTTFNTIVKFDTTGAQLNVSQQLFNLPAYEVYKASKSVADVAKWQLYLDRGDVVNKVAAQYIQVLSDMASIENSKSQVASDLELERQSQARKDTGTGTNLDLLRARVERQTRQQELIANTAQFEKDKVQLNRLMGLAADQPLQLTDAVPYHELEALPLETANQVALKRRKDLLALQAQMKTAELQRKAVKYERLPAVTLGGFYGVLGQTRGLYHGVFSAQGGINFPIFEEARIRGDREVADARLVHLRKEVDSLKAYIEAQIRSAMLDVNTSDELVKDATSNVDLAAEALDETRQRYRAGIDDNLPVVRAQATLANAQAQLVSALYQFNTAKLQLARNTGVVESQYDTYLGD
ncbi:Outer membrane protein TolC [Terriglobus roseus]|uniref:Outer membrane protein TolC n=2 Tax=Terriglobus roseus TaxID=392734 RepID=A0A1G7F0P8_9BACT|nr:Outer membrane protein TolC [Terriglobus roseus]